MRVDITGPGIKRAMQEGVISHRNVFFVYQWDSLGRILGVGYFLQDRGQPVPSDPEITWLQPGEFEISLEADEGESQVAATLRITHSGPSRPNERRHVLELLPIGSGSRLLLRSLFRVSRARTTGFVVQAEIWTTGTEGEEVCPVVRYDCAHGFVHRDLIARDGSKSKIPLGVEEPRAVISQVVDEMANNLRAWLVELGYEGLDATLLDAGTVKAELEKAKGLLLDLFDNPSKMSETESTLFQVKDGVDRVRRVFPPPPRDV